MSHFILITTLDVAGRSNNREHNTLREMAPRFDRVTVVFRRRGQPGAPRSALLSTRTEEWHEGHIRYIAVDPPLNPPEGAVRGATTHAPSSSALRRAAGRALDLVAIQKDRATIRALCAATARAIANRPAAPGTLVQAMGPWAALAALALRDRGLIPSVTYVDRDYEPGFVTSRLRRAHAARAEAEAAARADLTLSIGEKLARRLAPHAGARLHLSPTGVDVQNFPLAPHASAAPRLTYVGEVADWSCLDMALEALTDLRRSIPALELHAMGPSLPAYGAYLRDKAQQMGLGAAFHYPGPRPRPEAIALMAKGGIGLSVFRPTPLRLHAAPLKLCEYMAAGLPSLTTQGSEAALLAQRAGAGLTIAPTAEAIAEAARHYLAAPEAYAKASAAAVAHAQSLAWGPIIAREYALMRALPSLTKAA